MPDDSNNNNQNSEVKPDSTNLSAEELAAMSQYEDVANDEEESNSSEIDSETSTIHPNDLNNLNENEIPKNMASSIQNLDFLLDIMLKVTVELGHCRLKIKDLLKLGQGSIIELESTAGSALDIFINQKLMAKGEVIVTNDKYGIRLTEIISPRERLEQLS